MERFIAKTAVVIGDVILKENCSVWYGAVVRADSDKIIIGENSNIQDNSVIHVDPGFPVEIGDNVTIGHAAIIHGAKIEDNCLIGMRATIMNGAIIGNNSIIGACALITSNTIIPPNSLVIGSPAKVIRQLTVQEIEGIKKSAKTYVEKANYHKVNKFKIHQ